MPGVQWLNYGTLKIVTDSSGRGNTVTGGNPNPQGKTYNISWQSSTLEESPRMMDRKSSDGGTITQVISTPKKP